MATYAKAGPRFFKALCYIDAIILLDTPRAKAIERLFCAAVSYFLRRSEPRRGAAMSELPPGGSRTLAVIAPREGHGPRRRRRFSRAL